MLESASSDPTAAAASPSANQAPTRRFDINWQSRSSLCTLAAIAIFLISTSYFGWLQAPDPNGVNLEHPFSTQSWWYPREQNPARRLPLLPNVDLHGIFVLPDNTNLIWVVGEAGTIVHSNDGGKSWKVQSKIEWPSSIVPEIAESSGTENNAPPIPAAPAPAPPAPAAPAPAAPASEGKPEENPSGEKSANEKTVDSSRASQNKLVYVKQVPPDSGEDIPFPFALPPQSIINDPDLHSVSFVTDKIGWVVGEYGIILKTSDAGVTWKAIEGVDWEVTELEPKAKPEPPAAASASPPASQSPLAKELHRLSTAPVATVLAQPRLVTRSLPTLRRIRFLNEKEGFIAGNDGTIQRTQDGGETWQGCPARNKHTNYTDFAFNADGSLVCFVADTSLLIYRRAANAGKGQWEFASYSEKFRSEVRSSIAFVDDHQAVVSFAFKSPITLDLSSKPAIDFTEEKGTATAAPVHFVLADKSGISLIDSGGGTLIKGTGANWRHTLGPAVIELLDACRQQHKTWGCGTRGMVVVCDADGWRAVSENGCNNYNLGVSGDGDRCWTGAHKLAAATGPGPWQEMHLTSGMPIPDSLHMAAEGKDGWCVCIAPDMSGLRYERRLVCTGDAGDSWKDCSNLPDDVFEIKGQRNIRRIWSDVGNSLKYSDDHGTSWIDVPLNEYYVSDFYPSDSGAVWAIGGQNNEGRNVLLINAPQVTKIATVPRAFGWRICPATDGNSAWFLSDDGHTIQLSSTGKTLQTLPMRQPTEIRSVTGDADGKSVWYIERGGKIVHVSATEETIPPYRTPQGQELFQIRFADDGKIGYASGQGGLVLKTVDGGKSWQDAFPYQRSFSPAWYLSLLMVAGVFGAGYWPWVKRETKASSSRASIADLLVRDTPLELQDAKGSDLDRLASGLANFLRNPSTGAPLVLAITGKWGTGKSSLMNLIRGKLQRRGFCPVWFNAWHHQQEEHLLAALLQNIRSQAVPPIFSRAGVVFRWNLFWERYRRRAWLIALTLFCVGFLAVWLRSDTLGKIDPAKLETLLPFLPAGLALAPLLWGLKLISAFGINPAELVLPGVAKSGDVRAQTSFRHRFSEEFGEVTRALLPRPMVIFIDDLDRCQPDHMMTVLESVNFLSASGPCFIVLGMEERTVLECLTTKLNWRTDLGGVALTEPEVQTHRRKYAELWLEKLIQVRIPVPVLNEDVTRSILGNGKDANVPDRLVPSSRENSWRTRLRQTLRMAASWLPLVLFAGALGAGIWLGWDGPPKQAEKSEIPPWLDKVEFEGAIAGMPIHGKLHELAKLPKEVAVNPIQPSSPQVSDPPADPTNPESQPPEPPKKSPPKYIGQREVVAGVHDSPSWFWPLMTFLLLLLLGWLGLTLHTYDPVEDSPEFLNEVHAWKSVIVATHHTPRALKRFVNRLRFYAMLVRNPDNPNEPPKIDEKTIVGFGVLEACHHDSLCAALRGNQVEFSIDDATLRSKAAELARELGNSAHAQADDLRRLTAAIDFGENRTEAATAQE